jgi:hypothetical protein
MNARVGAVIERRGVRSLRDAWIRESVATTDDKLIASVKATCSKDALGQLRALLGEIQAWASGLVGLGSIEADALYNGDPLAVLPRCRPRCPSRAPDRAFCHARASPRPQDPAKIPRSLHERRLRSSSPGPSVLTLAPKFPLQNA